MRKLLLLGCLCLALPATAKDITVTATPVPLNPEDPKQATVDSLEFVAGFALDSSAPEWGGYSGMVLAADGRSLLAVSDVGHWLRLELIHDAAGRLTGVGAARIEPLLDESGNPVSGKEWSDAEEITLAADGQFLVSFERRHRVWRYASSQGVPYGPANAVPIPDDVSSLPENSGIESIMATPTGTLWLVSEGDPDPRWGSRGWFGKTQSWTEFFIERSDGFEPVAFGQWTTEGTSSLLERRYVEADGPAARVSLLSRTISKRAARFAGFTMALLRRPLTVDNFEAMAWRLGKRGVADIYLLSDDNQSDQQRTLLMQFRARLD